jgi:hypothetical protein
MTGFDLMNGCSTTIVNYYPNKSHHGSSSRLVILLRVGVDIF